MHFLSITEVFPPKLKNDEKKQALTLQRVDEYNQCILDSHMLLPAGPFGLIDMHHLTRGMRCAALHCTPALAHLIFRLFACGNGICDTVDAHQVCVVTSRSISCCLQMQVQRSLHLHSSHEQNQMLVFTSQVVAQIAHMMAFTTAIQPMMLLCKYGQTACSSTEL